MRIATVSADWRKPLARSVNFSRFMTVPDLPDQDVVLQNCNTRYVRGARGVFMAAGKHARYPRNPVGALARALPHRPRGGRPNMALARRLTSEKSSADGDARTTGRQCRE